MSSHLLKLHAAAGGFALSIALFVFLCGLASGYYGTFPLHQLKAAMATAKVLRGQLLPQRANADEGFIGFAEISRKDAAARRIRFLPGSEGLPENETFVVSGGKYQYYDICPDYGCVAVQYDRHGKVLHAWPFRPEEFRHQAIAEAAFEAPLFAPERNVIASDLSVLPDGDLIAIFAATNSFPSEAGIARLAPDGRFRWYRRDYTHHWPVVTKDGEILAPGHRIQAKPVVVPVAGETVVTLDCPSPYFNDTIRIFDLNGRLKREWSILDALIASPYRGLLIHAVDKCDPLHTNYIVPVGEALASHLTGISANDYLVSMRFISSFAILSHRTGAVLRLYRGSFALQHSVQPLEGSKVIMFDNRGAGPAGGPSRVLTYDLVSGREDVVFPANASRDERIFSNFAGNISLSADRQRALVAVTEMGRAYEIRISDGAILAKFDNLSDVHGQTAFSSERDRQAGRFVSFGVYYAQ